MRYLTLLVLMLGPAGVFPRTARAQLSYVDISSGLDAPELDTGKTEFEFGDVNGDGHVDIVSIGDHGSPQANSEHGVMVWFGDGAGVWSVFQYGDFGYGGVALGDVDNDQLIDVAYGMHHNYSGVDLGDQLIEVALGDGTGHFWTPWDNGLATNGETWGMFGTDLADVDNDGDLDVGCASFGGSNGVRIYVNDMDGTWTQSSALVTGQSSMLFEFGDINGDGHADFAAAYGSATVALGDGAGGFVASLSGFRAGVSLGDVNNDGRDDVAYVTAGGGMEVYTLTSAGVWQDFSGNLPTSGGFRLTQVVDMNLDGHGDVVAFAPGSDSPGTIVVYGGDGSGNWQLLASISTPENHGYAALRAGVDVDHNGYPDVVVVQEEDYFVPPFFWFDKNYAYCYGESSTPASTWIHPLYPRGGETFVAGSVRFIEWTAAVPAPGQPAVSIDLSLDGPAGPWLPVASSAPNSGRYQWSLASGLPTSSICHLRYTLGAVSAVTPQPFTILGAFLPGDYDGDGDVDLTDFAEFPACMTGPEGGPLAPGCVAFDFEPDDDVDLDDYAAFQLAFDASP
ncbi:MAG: FG-GAP repeat domain-containing protein [Planctomycetota bacterium]